MSPKNLRERNVTLTQIVLVNCPALRELASIRAVLYRADQTLIANLIKTTELGVNVTLDLSKDLTANAFLVSHTYFFIFLPIFIGFIIV